MKRHMTPETRRLATTADTTGPTAPQEPPPDRRSESPPAAAVAVPRVVTQAPSPSRSASWFPWSFLA